MAKGTEFLNPEKINICTLATIDLAIHYDWAFGQ